MTTPDQFSFDYALRNACAEFSADCYDEFARLARLIHARPGKFQLLVIDCRSEILRDRVIGKLNEMLAIAGRVSERLALTRDAYADFAAVESALSTLSGKADVIHVTGGAVWFDAVSWESFNIRREAIAQRVKANILLWLDAESVAAMAGIAIDLWAWRASVITFDEVAQPITSTALKPDVRAVDGRAHGERTKRIAVLREALRDSDLPDDLRYGLAIELGDHYYGTGKLDEALAAFQDVALPAAEVEKERALAMGRIANILQVRGELDGALRILREEVMPVFERLGDVRGRAITIGRIADILQARGELDEALRIRREEEMPVYERLGDVRSRAITIGKIADILQARGELDEALRIRREEELPVYERLGLVRERAMTIEQIANCLEAQGKLDEAGNFRREAVKLRRSSARSEPVLATGKREGER